MQNPLVLDRVALRDCGIRTANSTLLRWEERGLFPRRFRIGGCVFWDASAVEDHLAARAHEGAQ